MISQWKKVRSLHFKSGHWSSPIRFDRVRSSTAVFLMIHRIPQTEWKSYATTDSTFGPWCETLTVNAEYFFIGVEIPFLQLLSIDVRRVRRKEGALDLVGTDSETIDH